MIGEQLAAWRETLGISQGEAAKRAGVPRKQYWKVENDKLVTIETFRRVVQALQPPVLTIGGTSLVTEDRDMSSIRGEAMQAMEILQRLVARIDAATGATAMAEAAPADAAAGDAVAPAAAPPQAIRRQPTQQRPTSRATISLDDPVVLALIELLESRKKV